MNTSLTAILQRARVSKRYSLPQLEAAGTGVDTYTISMIVNRTVVDAI